jgi:hypothetical protein
VKLPTGAMLNVLVDEQNRIVGRNDVAQQTELN